MSDSPDPFDKLRAYLKGPPPKPQATFAKETGIVQSVISDLVNRARRPNPRHMVILNKLLGTTLEDWVTARLRNESRPRRKKAA